MGTVHVLTVIAGAQNFPVGSPQEKLITNVLLHTTSNTVF